MSGDGMNTFVTALTGTEGITSANLWSELAGAATLITTAVIVGFGIYKVGKVIKGLGKGKVRI